ncbi:50S ribosomal protein L1 [Candidatus Woesearchaeota archaeon]|nr:50S ribosomal protein L1 [Candidatus Woesearchaeota archaeon]
MIDKKTILETISKLKEDKKRNFTQSYDLIIKLAGLDLKKPDQHQDFFLTLHYSKGKNARVCALVGPELLDEAKKVFDKVILQDDFVQYSDKKKLKDLANSHDYFIAQANIMPKIAATFGKVLGTRGKMPNPKAGCVVPPKAALKPLYDKLQKTIRITVKNALMTQCVVGTENMDEEQVADNILTIYNQTVQHLPNHENNISKLLLKKTMGKPIEIR